jgi:hypothetical protein
MLSLSSRHSRSWAESETLAIHFRDVKRHVWRWFGDRESGYLESAFEPDFALSADGAAPQGREMLTWV